MERFKSMPENVHLILVDADEGNEFKSYGVSYYKK